MHTSDKCFRFLFSMTNGNHNAVIAMRRFQQGALCYIGAFPTRGAGTGTATVDPLISQGSIAATPDGQLLFACNAGNNTISAFSIGCGRPILLDVADARGTGPVSLAYFHGLLYVANRGDGETSSNITGFRVLGNGHLLPIEGADYPLSQSDAQPACIAFSPCGRYLVLSERTANKLDLYCVDPCGTLCLASIEESSGNAPFGLTFTRNGILLVSEVGPNALSSYAIEDGALRVISASITNGQQATCWVAATPNCAHAYTANAGTGNISHYNITPNGVLTYINSVLSVPSGTGAPIDCIVDPAGRFFYVLNGNDGTISVLQIIQGGQLMFLTAYQDICLPAPGAQGLTLT